jgi:hypothetical protein
LDGFRIAVVAIDFRRNWREISVELLNLPALLIEPSNASSGTAIILGEEQLANEPIREQVI